MLTYVNVRIKSTVSKFSKARKIVEIPKKVRDSFEIGEEVEIAKIHNKAVED